MDDSSRAGDLEFDPRLDPHHVTVNTTMETNDAAERSTDSPVQDPPTSRTDLRTRRENKVGVAAAASHAAQVQPRETASIKQAQPTQVM